jgi:hypothetical protein
MFPTPDQYFDMPVDQRRQLAQYCAQQMAPVIGGHAGWTGDGDALVNGAYQGRQTSLTIQLSFATMLVDVKLPARLTSIGLGMFQLNVDPHAGKQGGRRHGDDPGHMGGRQYLSPSVYFQGMQSELELQFNLLQRLPPQAQQALVQALSQFDRGFFMANDDSVTLMCPASVVLNAQAPQYVGYYVNLLFLLGNDISTAWRDVNLPMMPLG